MYKGQRKIYNSIVMFMLMLIVNMSVNVHDSLLMDTKAGDHNEVESLIELLMVSINEQWELPDAPDGVGEDQVAPSSISHKYTCSNQLDLLAYFPASQSIIFPQFTSSYASLFPGPVPPPPIINA